MRKVLVEKFDPSMPGWLRKRLLFTDNRSPKDVGYQSYDIHPRQRGDSTPSEGLFKDFINKNIDLNNAKFVSVDPQSLQKRNDPRLKEPYLPIFHLVGNSGGKSFDTVYAVGINDTDKWPSRSYKDEFADRSFKSIPLKRLLEFTQDFCYLDLSDPTNFLDKEKMSTRKNSLDGFEQRYTPVKAPGYYTYYNLRSKDTNKIINKYSPKDQLDKILDKSGYIKDPHKYDTKLKELKAKNYSKVLNDIYSRIKTLQAGMIEAFSDYNFKNLQGNINSDSFATFQELTAYYNQLVAKIDRIVEDYSNDPDMFSIAIQRVFDENSSIGSSYKNVMSRLRDLEKSTSDYINVPVDWDVEEEEENESFNRGNSKKRQSLSGKLSEDIENLNDVDPVIYPVMQDAKKKSERTSRYIDKEIKELDKKFPSDKQKVIGAEKQEVPKLPTEPKLHLDESLFTESSKDYNYIDLGYIDKIKSSAKIFNDGSIYVHTHHPYDDADYHWAVSKDDGIGYKIYIHSPGKFVKSIVIGGYDDENELIEQLKEVAKELIKLDKESKIKSKMVHY